MKNETYICSYCGNVVNAGVNFCERCGNSIVNPDTYNNAASEYYRVTPVQPNTMPQKKKSSFKIWFPILLSVVLIVAIVLVVIFNPWFDISDIKNVFTNKKEKAEVIPQYLLYLKDDELCGYSIDDSKNFDITSNLDEESSQYYYSSYNSYAINDKGTLLFYRDNYSEDTSYTDLYCKKLNVSEEDMNSVVKIDNEVALFAITNDGKYVYYIKYGDYNLYRHDLENKEKIASGVKNFCINSNGSRLIYINTDGDIYCRTDGENTLVDRSSEIFKVSDDLSTVYYKKDDIVYKKSLNSEKIKLASDVNEIININDDDSLYYLKDYTETLNYVDYIDQDIDFDGYIDPEDMTEPDWYDYFDSDYYYALDYESGEKYYEDVSDEYNRDYEKYEEDYERNCELKDYKEFLDELEYESEEVTCYDLYYSKDNKEDKICEDYSWNYDNYNNVLFYYDYDRNNIEKIKLSDAYDEGLDSTITEIDQKYYENNELSYAYKNTSECLNIENFTSLEYNEKNNQCHFITYDYINESKTENYELYEMTLKDEKFTSPELVYEDVYSYYITDGFEGIFTIRNRSDKTYLGDLYYNDKVIDYDVSYSTLNYDSVSKSLYYCSNYSYEGSTGTLNFYDGETKTKVADDINNYITYNKDDIYYISDYSSKTGEGTLYHYDGTEKTIIELDSVSNVLKCVNNQDNIEYLVDNIQTSYYYEEDEYDDYDDYDDDYYYDY